MELQNRTHHVPVERTSTGSNSVSFFSFLHRQFLASLPIFMLDSTFGYTKAIDWKKNEIGDLNLLVYRTWLIASLLLF